MNEKHDKIAENENDQTKHFKEKVKTERLQSQECQGRRRNGTGAATEK